MEADPDFTVTSAWAADNTVTSFERDPAKPGRLVLTLARGVTGGSAEVFWLLERPAPESRDAIVLPDVVLPDFLRGETAVAVTSPRPLVLEEGKGRRDGYERIDESDLPPELKEMADSTVLLALRRIGSAAPALSVQVLSFPDAVGIAGVIDRGRILTIATRDGMRIDRWQLELQTRESLIRLPLPDRAELWSLQVDGKPARPLTEAGQLVVPLGRGEKAARLRRIEIVLATPAALVVSGRGTRRIEMPKLPLPVTHAEWDLLLPETSQYRYAGGTVVPIPVESSEVPPPAVVRRARGRRLRRRCGPGGRRELRQGRGVRLRAPLRTRARRARRGAAGCDRDDRPAGGRVPAEPGHGFPGVLRSSPACRPGPTVCGETSRDSRRTSASSRWPKARTSVRT